jgi:carbon-monoxide dehydrogenase large subunit
LPALSAATEGVPTIKTPLGAKGAGEIGTIGAPAPILNAIADAIGGDDFDMPTALERIWRMLDDGNNQV